MSRLYWANASGVWALAISRESETLINVEATSRLGLIESDEVKGYSIIEINTGCYWYMHYRDGSRICRTLVKEAEVPKSVRLLEMFQ